MTDDEQKLVEQLGDVWNAFLALPEQHSSDRLDMLAAIHGAQRIVMARPAFRKMQDLGK